MSYANHPSPIEGDHLSPPDHGSITPPHMSNLQQQQPVAPLAPLEFLQNQRRGSITDPSLHAHTHSPPLGRDDSQHMPSPSITARLGDPSRTKSAPIVTQPAAHFVFGDATPQIHNRQQQSGPSSSNPNSDKSLRRLLHSPTIDDTTQHLVSHRSISDPQRPSDQFTRAMSGPPEPHDLMSPPDDLDRRRVLDSTSNNMQPSKHHPAAGETADHVPDTFPTGFDWGMRRHSIAVGSPVNPSYKPSGLSRESPLKRKMSSDRTGPGYQPVAEETDAFGHGLPPEDMAAPTLKARRSSNFEGRIGTLTLYDRRDSLDSRMPSSTTNSSQQYWERRDSVNSNFSNMSSGGGYTSSTFSADGRPVHAYPWSGNSPAMPAPPGTHSADATMADLNYADSSHGPHPNAENSSQRRMSVPDATLPGGAERHRRIRPRPNDRDGVGETSPTSSEQPETPILSNGGVLHSSAAPTVAEGHPLPTGSIGVGMLPSLARDALSPYSRSPELRVSHKLAERKRRKEMKELFDELRDQLPADRSMKASKWEILSKAIDYISSLTGSLNDAHRQVEILRVELEKTRNSQYPSITNPPIVHSQGPTIVTSYNPSDPSPGPASASSATSRSASSHAYPLPNGGLRSPAM